LDTAGAHPSSGHPGPTLVLPHRLLDDCRLGLYNPSCTGIKWGAGGDGRLAGRIPPRRAPLARALSAAFCRQQEGGSGLAQSRSVRAAVGRGGRGEGASPLQAGGL